MIGLGSTRALRVWAYGGPADLRAGYDALYRLVQEGLAADPLSGDYFLFVNRDRTRAKVLLWDGTGLCIFMKRLEQGRFACLWRALPATPVELTVTELSLFLEGSKAVGRIALSPKKYSLRPLAKGG